MEKHAQIENVQVAGVITPLVNIDNMPHWQIEMMNDREDIPEMLYKKSCWISVQDLISIVADSKTVPILSGTMRCEYSENPEILKLYLKGCWSLIQLECIDEAFQYIPCNGSKDISFDSCGTEILITVRFLSQA